MNQKTSKAWPAVLESSAASDIIRSLLRAIRTSEPVIRRVYENLPRDAITEDLAYALHNLIVAASCAEQAMAYLARRGKQRVLFAGMDCLPGQRDLFETDGEAVQPGA